MIVSIADSDFCCCVLCYICYAYQVLFPLLIQRQQKPLKTFDEGLVYIVLQRIGDYFWKCLKRGVVFLKGFHCSWRSPLWLVAASGSADGSSHYAAVVVTERCTGGHHSHHAPGGFLWVTCTAPLTFLSQSIVLARQLKPPALVSVWEHDVLIRWNPW